MKGKHAQKNFGAVGAMAPTPLSLKTRGGGGGRGAGGSCILGPGPAAPPWGGGAGVGTVQRAPRPSVAAAHASTCDFMPQLRDSETEPQLHVCGIWQWPRVQ